MMISMPNRVAMLGICHTFLAAGPSECASGSLTLPSPPPQRHRGWDDVRKARERGESALTLRAGARSPAHAGRSGLRKVFPTKRANWRAIYPNLKLNPKLNPHLNSKQDNLCEEVARTAQSAPDHRLAAKMAFRSHRKSWDLRRASRLGFAADPVRPRP